MNPAMNYVRATVVALSAAAQRAELAPLRLAHWILWLLPVIEVTAPQM